MNNGDKVPFFGYIPLIGGVFDFIGKVPVVGDVLKFTGNLIDIPANTVRNLGVGVMDSVTSAFDWGTRGVKFGFLGGLVKGGVEGFQRAEAGEDVNFVGTAVSEGLQMAMAGGAIGATGGAALGAGRGLIETAKGLGSDIVDVKDDLVTPSSVPQVTAGQPQKRPSIT